MTHDLRTDDADAAPQPITPSNPDAPVRVDVAMPRGLYDRHGVRIWVAGTGSKGAFTQTDRSRALPGLGRQALDRLLASRTPRDASRRARDIARQVSHAMLGADHRDPVDQR